MKRFARFAAWTLVATLSTAALGSEAQTSASAGSHRGQRNGTANATASYEGDVGFARTDSRSGAVNLARGVAVGFDEDGLSLSISNAIAPRFGPALATNFNLSIDADGDVSTSHGIALANSPIHRDVSAGGSTRSGGRFATPVATSTASANTDPFGRAIARTGSHVSPKPVLARGVHRETRVVHREARSEVRRYFIARD